MYIRSLLLSLSVLCHRATAQIATDPNDPFSFIGEKASLAGVWAAQIPLICAEGCLNPIASYL